MADNFTANAGSGGSTFAADDIGPGVLHPRVKVEWGADGTVNDTSASAPLPVQLVTLAAPTGVSIYRSIDLDETEEEVKGTAGAVYGILFSNMATSTRFLKFYNATAASVTVGSTTPVITLALPGNASDDVSGVFQFPSGIPFSTAITMAATTGIADADTGAPAANDVIVNVLYV